MVPLRSRLRVADDEVWKFHATSLAHSNCSCVSHDTESATTSNFYNANTATSLSTILRSVVTAEHIFAVRVHTENQNNTMATVQ